MYGHQKSIAQRKREHLAGWLCQIRHLWGWWISHHKLTNEFVLVLAKISCQHRSAFGWFWWFPLGQKTILQDGFFKILNSSPWKHIGSAPVSIVYSRIQLPNHPCFLCKTKSIKFGNVVYNFVIIFVFLRAPNSHFWKNTIINSLEKMTILYLKNWFSEKSPTRCGWKHYPIDS